MAALKDCTLSTYFNDPVTFNCKVIMSPSRLLCAGGIWDQIREGIDALLADHKQNNSEEEINILFVIYQLLFSRLL